MKKQSGFSLVELVIVIVVLGVLAATALPKFLDITDEAKKASIEGVAGGYATAILSARAQWEAEGRPAEGGFNVVDYDGSDFILTDSNNDGFRDGYPIGIFDGSSVVTVTDASCVTLMEELLQNPPSVVANDLTSDTSYSAQATDETTCTYTQLQGSAGHSFIYNSKKGRVSVNVQE